MGLKSGLAGGWGFFRGGGVRLQRPTCRVANSLAVLSMKQRISPLIFCFERPSRVLVALGSGMQATLMGESGWCMFTSCQCLASHNGLGRGLDQKDAICRRLDLFWADYQSCKALSTLTMYPYMTLTKFQRHQRLGR